MSASQNHIPPLPPPRLPLLLISPLHPLFSLLLLSCVAKAAALCSGVELKALWGFRKA